jgi:8-oxo-dGTP diphosphatase
MNKIIKYGLIILNNGKFLINRKFNTKLFLMPGGKPEENENIKDCLIREIMEEHSVELIRDSIGFFGDFEDIAANEPDTMIFMKLYTGKIRGIPKISMEIEEQRWFGRDDDPNILSPLLKNKILPALIARKII